MRKMNKKRELVLSVFLSVAMVLTYMAAPVLPILGSSSDTTLYAEDSPILWELPEDGVLEWSAEEGYTNPYSFADYDEETAGGWIRSYLYVSEPISNVWRYLKLEFVGDETSQFHYYFSGAGDGYGYLPDSLSEGRCSFVILTESLGVGEHICTLNMYVDPTGNGNFQEPTQSAQLKITVNNKRDYIISASGLDWASNQGDPRYFRVSNKGKKDIYVNPAKLELSGETELFEVVPASSEPILIPVNSERSIATISPRTQGADIGRHELKIHVIAEGDVADAYQTVSFVKLSNGAALSAEPSSIDFGFVSPGFSASESKEVTITNTGSYDLALTGFELKSTDLFKTDTYGYHRLGSGSDYSFSIELDPSSEKASQPGEYDDTVVVHITAYGDGDSGEQKPDLEIPVHVVITEDTCSITVDAQGHGEDIVLENIPKGANIYETACNAFQASFDGGEPAAEGLVYGGLSKSALSSYNNWDEYLEAQNALREEILTEDTTLYAMWLPELSDIELTTEPPVCGASAADAAPGISVPEGAGYAVEDTAWMADSKDHTPYKGAFNGGQEYCYTAFVESEFPYAFSSDLHVTIDGDDFDVSGSRRDLNGVDLLPYPTMTAVHSLEKVEAKEGTCTDEGRIEHYVCQGCGKMYADAAGTEEITDVAIPVTDHNWGDPIVLKAPTCGEDGVCIYVCRTNSLHMKVGYIEAAKQHSLVKVEAMNATCTEPGNIEHYACENCGKTFQDEEGTVEIANVILKAEGHDYVKTLTRASLSENGSIVTKCEKCGREKENTTISYPKTIKLSATSYTYDGQAKKPTVSVKDANGKTIDSANYTVTYATGRKNVGSYKVTVKMKGNYSGTKTLTFKINPKGTSLKSVTAGSKKFTAKWSKQATQTTGYQIYYSTSSTKPTASTSAKATISSTGTLSKTVSGLTGGKKYYVYVRTYKTVSGTKYYSAWSAAKTVTTKK